MIALGIAFLAGQESDPFLLLQRLWGLALFLSWRWESKGPSGWYKARESWRNVGFAPRLKDKYLTLHGHRVKFGLAVPFQAMKWPMFQDTFILFHISIDFLSPHACPEKKKKRKTNKQQQQNGVNATNCRQQRLFLSLYLLTGLHLGSWISDTVIS